MKFCRLEWRGGAPHPRGRYAQTQHQSGGLGAWGRRGGGRRRTSPAAWGTAPTRPPLGPTSTDQSPPGARLAPALRSALPTQVCGTAMLNGPLSRKAGPGRHSTRPRPSGLAHARGGPAQEGLAKGVGAGLPARGCGVIMPTQASARPRPPYLKHWSQHGGAHADA